MNTHTSKKQEYKNQSAANTFPPKKSGGQSSFQFADNRSEAIAHRKLQEVVNNSPQAMQLKTFREMVNNSPQAKHVTKSKVWTENDIAQRYPIPLNALNDNDENPGVFTDSRHNWLRMVESDLGSTTYELLKLNGASSGSLMIWEEDYDQYRFSPDGQSFDDAMFPPHFMEEITGDARIADKYDDDLEQKGIGEYGVGFSPAKDRIATLETFGLVSCVGFALVGESAGFLCHVLIGIRRPHDEGMLKAQVNALVNKFRVQSGENDLYCQLVFDHSNYGGGEPDWLEWMKPDGIHTETKDDTKHKVVIRGQDGPSLMWRGNPIRY